MLCRHCPAPTKGNKGGSRSPSPGGAQPSPVRLNPLPGLRLNPRDSCGSAAHTHGLFCAHQACFIGHSFGSIVMTWLVVNDPQIVGSMLLLDPVSVMLQEPDIAHNFLYREPEQGSVVQAFFKYFVATELHIANTLHRHFWWFENVLWLDDLPERLRRPETFKVMLAGGDEIVNVPLVTEHLKTWRPAGAKGKADTAMAVELVIKPDLDHAEVVVSDDGASIPGAFASIMFCRRALPEFVALCFAQG